MPVLLRLRNSGSSATQASHLSPSVSPAYLAKPLTGYLFDTQQ